MATAMASLNPLDQLQDMVNLVLVETGNIFSDPAKYHHRAVAQTNAHLKDSLPRYWATFHDALDSLEEDLMQAKALLRRDLRTLQTARIKPIEKSSPGASKENTVKSPINPSDAIASPATGQEIGGDFDIIMSDEADEAPHAVVENLKSQKVMDDATLSQDLSESNKLSKKEVQDTEIDQKQLVEPNPESGSPAAVDDVDLDSIFEEVKGEKDPSGNESDVKAHDTNLGSVQGIDLSINGLAEGHADKASDAAPETVFTNADVSSLLPGLESYANDHGDGDAFGGLVDFADFGNTPFDDGTAMHGGDSISIVDDFMAGQGVNKSFDELFDYGEFNNEEGTDGQAFLDGTEFDENFFKLDNSGS